MFPSWHSPIWKLCATLDHTISNPCFFALELVLTTLCFPTATQTTTEAASYLVLHVDASSLTNVTRSSSFLFMPIRPSVWPAKSLWKGFYDQHDLSFQIQYPPWALSAVHVPVSWRHWASIKRHSIVITDIVQIYIENIILLYKGTSYPDKKLEFDSVNIAHLKCLISRLFCSKILKQSFSCKNHLNTSDPVVPKGFVAPARLWSTHFPVGNNGDAKIQGEIVYHARRQIAMEAMSPCLCRRLRRNEQGIFRISLPVSYSFPRWRWSHQHRILPFQRIHQHPSKQDVSPSLPPTIRDTSM